MFNNKDLFSFIVLLTVLLTIILYIYEFIQALFQKISGIWCKITDLFALKSMVLDSLFAVCYLDDSDEQHS